MIITHAYTHITVQVDTVDTLDNSMVAGKWGLCSLNCPGAVAGDICKTLPGSDDPNRPCVFPFTFAGVTYNGCTKDNGDAWCATKVTTYTVVAGYTYQFYRLTILVRWCQTFLEYATAIVP